MFDLVDGLQYWGALEMIDGILEHASVLSQPIVKVFVVFFVFILLIDLLVYVQV